MFKHLTRNLKLGLTTLTILTAGAGAAFAQPAGFNDAIDPIADCLNSGSRGPSYCTVAVVNCINNPFGSSCATTLGTKAQTVAKVRYCQNQDVPSVESEATAHACHDTWGGANAAMWAKQNPDAPDSPDTDTPQHQFLNGGASDLDSAGVAIYTQGALYLNTATFDGRALDGDATDGVAFFSTATGNFYAGILSGTDLGAPVTQTSGTASWVGRFQTLWLETNTDFILEVTFGGDGDNAGSIEAFVDRKGGLFYGSPNNISHFYLKGDFDDNGLITGTINAGDYTNNDRWDTTGNRYPGLLTGLIGQEGAVGVFHDTSYGGYYSGGFVARPPSAQDTAFLDKTCSATDPFTSQHQEFCYLEYEDERATRIELCNNADNRTNPLCMDTNLVKLCEYAPFADICSDGDTYESARAGKIDFCYANPTDLSCTGVTNSPNAVAWVNSFATALTDTPTPPTDGSRRLSQFLKASKSGVNRGDIYVGSPRDISLNLNTATFGGNPLGGDAADGFASIGGRVHDVGRYYFYEGIFSGTDLGAPLTQTSGTASWVGRFQAIHQPTNREFVLEIDFTGTDDTAGSITAFVQQSSWVHYYLEGTYDSHGLITGTVVLGGYWYHVRDPIQPPSGVLTGLIGQEGAVGVFHSNYSGTFYGHAGGFVARPANADDKAYLNRACTYDPFGYLCYLEKDKQVERIIECTEGSNASTASCTRAVRTHNCLANPFAGNCVNDFADYYVLARENRAQFCVNNLTHSLCTASGAANGVCTYAPFASICFRGDRYDAARAGKINFCLTNPTDLSCTGVTDNPNAITWANSFVTTENPNGLPVSLDTVSRANQFLKGGATALSSIGVTDVVSGSLNLATATFDGNSLGGDESDGVAFFRGTDKGGLKYYYAGILSGTDLGGPVIQTTGSADWNGSLQIVHSGGSYPQPSATDFTLTVNFGGTDDRAGSISSNFRYAPYADIWALSGHFDDNGIITGNIRTSSSTGSLINAKVSGLIGQQGAVGAFHSVNVGIFSGGFVARPTPAVQFLDWTNSFEEELSTSPISGPGAISQFLKGSANGLSTSSIGRFVHSSLNLADATFGGNRLGGDRSDSVVFYRGSQITTGIVRYYAGLLSGTDLGGPLTQTTGSADWKGSMQIVAKRGIDRTVDFTLTVNFGGTGDKAGSISSNNSLYASYHTYWKLSGDFDTNGVIAGKISNSFDNRIAKVSGLIGQEGAVGAFYGVGDYKFSGGFVAVPPPPVVDYADWVEVFEPATTPATPARTQFLAGTATLITDASPNQVVTFATAEYDGTPFGGAATNGFATNNNGLNNYAGLLSGVNLGAPLTSQTAVGVWQGYLVSHTETNTSAPNFLLTVNFGAGEQAGTLSATPTQHVITGSFDDRGVITGEVTRTDSNNVNDVRAAVLTGLIGSDGAIGVFHNNANQQSLVGGFVAQKAPITNP